PDHALRVHPRRQPGVQVAARQPDQPAGEPGEHLPGRLVLPGPQPAHQCGERLVGGHSGFREKMAGRPAAADYRVEARPTCGIPGARCLFTPARPRVATSSPDSATPTRASPKLTGTVTDAPRHVRSPPTGGPEVRPQDPAPVRP